MPDNSIKVDVSPEKRRQLKALLARKKIAQGKAFDGWIDTMLEFEKVSDTFLSLCFRQITNKRERKMICRAIVEHWAK